MYKKFAIFFCGIIIISLGFPAKRAFCEVEHKVLIVYDAENIYGDSTNILSLVTNIALESKNEVQTEELNNLGYIDKNETVVFINCNENSLNKKTIEDLNRNKVIYISNIPIEGLKPKISMSISSLKSNYISSRNEILKYITDGKLESKKYLVIENVNPFINLNTLAKKIEYLKERGIPFILDTIPVYMNTNTEAMERFCEVLRYAQSSGGCIVLSTPYIQSSEATAKDIFSKVVDGYENYIKYQVYPVGMSMPEEALYKEGALEYINKTNTLFIRKGDESYLNLGKIGINKISNFIQEVNYNKWKDSDYENFYGSVGISINIDDTVRSFENTVNNLTNIGVYFDNPGNLNSNMDIKNQKVEFNLSGTYLNGKDVTQRFYEPSKKLTESKKVNEGDKETINISKLSNRLMIFALVACIAFIIITIISKRIDRKKYFR